MRSQIGGYITACVRYEARSQPLICCAPRDSREKLQDRPSGRADLLAAPCKQPYLRLGERMSTPKSATPLVPGGAALQLPEGSLQATVMEATAVDPALSATDAELDKAAEEYLAPDAGTAEPLRGAPLPVTNGGVEAAPAGNGSGADQLVALEQQLAQQLQHEHQQQMLPPEQGLDHPIRHTAAAQKQQQQQHGGGEQLASYVSQQQQLDGRGTAAAPALPPPQQQQQHVQSAATAGVAQMSHAGMLQQHTQALQQHTPLAPPPPPLAPPSNESAAAAIAATITAAATVAVGAAANGGGTADDDADAGGAAPPAKLCKICGETKAADEFYPSRCTSNGLYYYCKACSREKSRKFVQAKERVRQPRVAQKRCAKCGETKCAGDFNRYERSSVGLHSYCKACSRRDSKTRREKAPAVPEPTVGEQLCSVCKVVKPSSDFTKDKTRRTGLSHRCRVCKLSQNARCFERRQAEQVVVPQTKQCSSCNETKASSDFWKRPTSTDGLRSECKQCSRKRYRDWVGKGSGGGAGEGSGSEEAFGVGQASDGGGRADSGGAGPTTVTVTAKVCRSCSVHKPADQFPRNRASADGLEACCASCSADTRGANNGSGGGGTGGTAGGAKARGGSRAPTVSHKACTRCGQTKEAAQFKRNGAVADGLAKSCKACAQTKGKANSRKVNAVDAAPSLALANSVMGVPDLLPPGGRGMMLASEALALAATVHMPTGAAAAAVAAGAAHGMLAAPHGMAQPHMHQQGGAALGMPAAMLMGLPPQQQVGGMQQPGAIQAGTTDARLCVGCGATKGRAEFGHDHSQPDVTTLLCQGCVAAGVQLTPHHMQHAQMMAAHHHHHAAAAAAHHTVVVHQAAAAAAAADAHHAQQQQQQQALEHGAGVAGTAGVEWHHHHLQHLQQQQHHPLQQQQPHQQQQPQQQQQDHVGGEEPSAKRQKACDPATAHQQHQHMALVDGTPPEGMLATMADAAQDNGAAVVSSAPSALATSMPPQQHALQQGNPASSMPHTMTMGAAPPHPMLHICIPAGPAAMPAQSQPGMLQVGVPLPPGAGLPQHHHQQQQHAMSVAHGHALGPAPGMPQASQAAAGSGPGPSSAAPAPGVAAAGQLHHQHHHHQQQHAQQRPADEDDDEALDTDILATEEQAEAVAAAEAAAAAAAAAAASRPGS